MTKKLTIEGVAIAYKNKIDGKTVALYSVAKGRHFQLIHANYPNISHLRLSCDEVQGFMTSEGNFVDRVEAKRIASEAGQIKEDNFGLKDLYSEDVW